MFRLAVPGDGEQLAAVAGEAYGKYLPLLDEPPAPVLLDYREVARSGLTYVAEEEDTVQGMVTIAPRRPDLVLRNLAVRPHCQRRGTGTRLTAFVEDLARAGRFRGVVLWTRAEMHENVAFYTRRGYVPTRVERSAGAHRVFFHKRIPEEPVG